MADRPPRPGFQFPGPPPKEALEYFRHRGFKPGFSYRDVWLEEHALGFTVAKAMEIDLLKDIRAEIDKAIAEGRTLRQFQKDLTPILQKKGWWGKKAMEDPETGEIVQAQLGSPRRLRTIYQSNLRAARAAGQWDRAQRTKKVRPYFLYALGPSKERRKEHEAWAGTILPVDDPWWNDHFPPNGWGCKCRVRQISEAEAKRRGGETSRPPRDMYLRKDPRTGRFHVFDRGVDPAWATNPGKYRGRVLAGHLHDRVDAAGHELAEAAHRSLMKKSPLLEGFHQQIADYGQRHPKEARAEKVEIKDRVFKERLGDFWIALLDDRARKALKAPSGAKLSPTRLVRLSPETALKQMKHMDRERHKRPLRLSDYRDLLPEVIRHGEMYKSRKGNHLLFFHRSDGRWYQAVVKQTGNNELFLTTFHEAKRRTRNAARRQASTSLK